MATNNDRITSAVRARVYLGDVGATAPIDATTPPEATEWTDVGFTRGDSLSFSTEPEFEEVDSHQSDYPTRRLQTTDAATVGVDLQEWSKENFIAVYGGGQVEEVSAGSGVWKFSPPRLGNRVEKAALIDVIDGIKHYRFVFPRAMQIEGVELALNKGEDSILPLRLAIIGADDTDPWYALTDDSAFAIVP